jgi:hypothetical protein
MNYEKMMSSCNYERIMKDPELIPERFDLANSAVTSPGLARLNRLWNQYCEWITSVENRIYIGWFGGLMIPTGLVAAICFLLAFLTAPAADMDGIREPVLDIICSVFPSFKSLGDSLQNALFMLESHILIWIAALSVFLVLLLTLVIALVNRRSNNLKPIAAEGFATESSSVTVASRFNTARVNRVASKGLGKVRRFGGLWLDIGNSRMVQIPRMILTRTVIRFGGWLDRVLSLFKNVLRVFSSFAVLLGFKSDTSNRLLDPLDAITLGDVNYMSTPRRIERTFAKTKSNPQGGSQVRFISAFQKTAAFDRPSLTPTSKPPQSAIAPSNSNRRTPDRSLEPFRSMARQIQPNPSRFR